MRIATLMMMAAAVCGGQTVVNGGRDYKGLVKASGTAATVDFSGSASTAPVKTGTTAARPGSCTVGQIYFSTDATVGQNLAFCTSSGVWTQMTGGGGGGSSTAISYCAPGSASATTYTCSPSPAVSSYAAGVTLAFVPDVNGAGGATTVNVSGLGAKSVKQADGTTNPASTDLVAGKMCVLSYDGTVFRLELNAVNAANITSGTVPAARLPLPAVASVGGVQSKASASHQFLTAINTDGSVSAAQPASTDLSDTTCAVTVGATPAMNANSCNGTGGSYNSFKLGPLAQNASPTFTNGLAGRTYVIQMYQGASTAFTVTWPGNVIGGCMVSPTLSSRTQLVGVMDSAGSSLLVQSCSYLDDASTIIQGPTRTAPASPASGILTCWFDSTATTELCKDSSGNVYAAVKTAGGATSNQWVSYINASGVPQTSQPAFSNLSGSLAGSQLPALSGDVSNSSAAVTVSKVNGTSVATNSTADQALVTTAAATAGWTSVPNCGDSTHALSYATSTHTFACQNITAAAGAVSLDSLLAAGGANSINSADNMQTWKWTLTTSGKTGFRFSENTAGTAAGTPILIGIDTLSGSTVNPLRATAGGTANGVLVDTTGKLAKIGTGSIVADALTGAPARRVCTMRAGADGGSALANADLADARQCYIPYGATIVEITVAADAGTPNVIVGRNRAGSVVNLTSSALATASAGGLACSNTGGTTGLDGATTCSATLQNTSINAGDWLDLVGGTAGGTAKRMSVSVTYTVN